MHIPERALQSNFDPLLAPRLFFTCLTNRIPHIVLALVNKCFYSRWDTQCKCAALMHRCNTTRIKKSNMGASMLASYHCNWNYFLLLGSKLNFELSTCHSGGCNPTFNTSTRVKPNWQNIDSIYQCVFIVNIWNSPVKLCFTLNGVLFFATLDKDSSLNRGKKSKELFHQNNIHIYKSGHFVLFQFSTFLWFMMIFW